MIILIAIAAICLVLGILFLVNIDFLKKLEAFLNKSIMDTTVLLDKHYKIIGVFLIIFSCVLATISFHCFILRTIK